MSYWLVHCSSVAVMFMDRDGSCQPVEFVKCFIHQPGSESIQLVNASSTGEALVGQVGV